MKFVRLLADDNADMRDYIQHLLEPYCQVYAMADGEAALEFARISQPDLIISDVMMPKIDGFEFLSSIRADQSLKTICFILLSARAGEEAKIEGLQAGADDYLVKPFNAKELVARIKTNLELYRARYQESQNLLRNREQVFRTIANASPASLWKSDEKAELVYINQAWVDWTGKPMENHLGFGWIDSVLPEDRELTLKKFLSAFSARKHFREEFRILRRDGQISWCEKEGTPAFEADGTFSGYVGYCSDITDRKLAEVALKQSSEKLKVVLESLPQMTWTNSPNGEAIFFNGKWYDYTGLSFEETRDWAWISVVHPDDIEQTLANYKKALETGQVFEVENRCKRHDGVYRWHLNRALPLKNENGEIILWVGTATDVHEQKMAKEHLEKLVRERTMQLQRSNEDLEQFAHVASHDLKEPLRKIKTFSFRLEDEYRNQLPANAKTYINKIHSATDRMGSMIEGVLAYSKVSADTEKKIETIALSELIRNIEQDLEVLIHQKSATIIATNLPVLQGSQVLLYQLFYNLINNALKFSRAEVAPIIRMTAETTEKEGRDFITVTISDNGIGFEQKFAKHIFDTFTRLNSKDHYEGTGLGLSLCKKIVQRHGGFIEATGKPGEGATFKVVLPNS